MPIFKEHRIVQKDYADFPKQGINLTPQYPAKGPYWVIEYNYCSPEASWNIVFGQPRGWFKSLNDAENAKALLEMGVDFGAASEILGL